MALGDSSAVRADDHKEAAIIAGARKTFLARGFDAATIAVLNDQFPPTENAPEKLHSDYQDWLREIGAK